MTKRKKELIVLIIGIVAVCIALGITGFILYGKYQMSRIPALSFGEALAYTAKDNERAVITVGTIKDGEASFTVYGSNGAELPLEAHTYEIGSLTKTFTAALVSKAVQEGRIRMGDSIDCYLELPTGKSYPTIEQLLTHTSGYRAYYFETPMISNFLAGRNDFCGVSERMVLDRISKAGPGDGEHPFLYSNFGFAVLGLVLEAVYQEDYTSLMNAYLRDGLGLQGTKISDGSGDLGNYWDWRSGDAYLSAGALTSDITDMLAYALMQLDGEFESCHKVLAEISGSSDRHAAMGIHMDAIGMSWITDEENGFIWHNGGTGHYNSYLGFCPETQTAAVVLSNLSPSAGIPATVLGVKLLQSLQ